MRTNTLKLHSVVIHVWNIGRNSVHRSRSLQCKFIAASFIGSPKLHYCTLPLAVIREPGKFCWPTVPGCTAPKISFIASSLHTRRTSAQSESLTNITYGITSASYPLTHPVTQTFHFLYIFDHRPDTSWPLHRSKLKVRLC